jgi:interferon-induced transmembrane protein/zinc ribbon protein
MFCTQCGANNADTAIICVQCGRNLQAAPPGIPPAAIAPTPAVDVPNYLVFAILATVLCCLPAGIPAIVYAAQVNGKLQAGDIAGAQAASKNAKMWCWISFGAGLAIGLIYMLVFAAGAIRQMGSH